MKDIIVNKLFSGRFIMTVAFTITTCYLAYSGKFPSEAFVGLVTLVANSYFTRSDRDVTKVGTDVPKKGVINE